MVDRGLDPERSATPGLDPRPTDDEHRQRMITAG